MIKEAGIKWLFLDLNSYFASVEQQEHPHLRGKPVAVTPADTDHTCAIAASYEAKAYGVKTGTIIRDAKKMCPNLHCTVARHDKYVEYHHRIIDEVINHIPINKIWSIDELSSRLPPNKRNVENAKIIAQNLRQGIWNNVGEAINCSIGFAPNSFLAKIACEIKKPNGLTIIQQEDLPHAILRLKLTDIPGIGRNMERRLHAANVFNMQDLWNLTPKHSRKIWGAVQGERFWYMLHGYDIEPPATKTSTIGHSRVLDPQLRSPDTAKLIMRKLTIKAAQRLIKTGLFAQSISISARSVQGHKHTHNIRIPATQDPFTFLNHVDTLWPSIVTTLQTQHNSMLGTFKIKKISVILNNLTQEETITADLLLRKNIAKTQSQENNKNLTEAIAKLQHKYKKNVVSLGIIPKTSSGYVGTKIAFSRVPKTEEFWT